MYYSTHATNTTSMYMLFMPGMNGINTTCSDGIRSQKDRKVTEVCASSYLFSCPCGRAWGPSRHLGVAAPLYPGVSTLSAPTPRDKATQAPSRPLTLSMVRKCGRKAGQRHSLMFAGHCNAHLLLQSARVHQLLCYPRLSLRSTQL